MSSLSPAPARRLAVIVLFALLVVALVARTGFLVWEPPFDGTIRLDDVQPLGDAYWTMNLYVGGPAFAVSWVATAIFIALLARGRTAAVTVGAAVVVGLAGILFSIVIVAEVLPFVFAAGHADAAALFDAFNAELALLMPAIFGAQIGIAAAVLVFFVVALATRAVPRWFAVAGLVYLVAFFALPFEMLGRPAVIVADILQVLLVAGIGWFGLRSVLRPAA